MSKRKSFEDYLKEAQEFVSSTLTPMRRAAIADEVLIKARQERREKLGPRRKTRRKKRKKKGFVH